MKPLHFFLVRDEADYYTVVVEGAREEVMGTLMCYFPEVRYLKSENQNHETTRTYTGCRHIENGIIRGCWFTRQLRPFSQFSKPIKADFDPRYEYEEASA